MMTLICALCLAQVEDDPETVRARIAIAIALEQVREPVKAPMAPVSAYNAALEQSTRAGSPLVVGIGCDPPRGNWLTARVEHLDGYAAPSIVVSRGGNWILTLGPGASAQDISRALTPTSRPRLVEVPLSPFPGAEPPTADDDPAPLVSGKERAWIWTDADIPEYMERYESARFTQRISVTDGRDAIVPVPREYTEAKYRAPGGLAHLAGWHSALYKWAPHRWWVGTIPVLNSMGYFQGNRGYKRAYEDGAEFLDVLTNTSTGRVFEVRKAMKANGDWQRFRVYRDPAHYPRGYRPVKNCASCHEGGHGHEPGTGGYAVGLISGGDTIFSDPFPPLEGK